MDAASTVSTSAIAIDDQSNDGNLRLSPAFVNHEQKCGAGARQDSGGHISRIPFRLACPFLPTMMWSCTEIPSGAAMSTIALVIWMSACDGVGSPEGWLCTRISAVADNSSARLMTS